MTKSSIKRVFAILLVATALSACGFHLRGALTLPTDLGPIKVVSKDPYSPLAQALALALENAGAAGASTQVTGTGAQADASASLNIISEFWRDSPISVDEVGRALEYSLQHAVVFDLRRADGSELVPRQTLELSRDYVAAATDLTGTDSEREILVREMRRDMVAAVLRRIDAVSKAPAPAAAETTQAQ